VRLGFFLAIVGVRIGVKRQAGDGFGQDPHTGIDGCGLHRRSFVDCFSGGRPSEEKTKRVIIEIIFGFITGMEKVS